MLLSVELMFNAALVALVVFDRMHDGITGQTFAIAVIFVAVAEAAIALAVLAVWLRHRDSLDVDDVSELKW
jgi:NADH-quinone oxidoreductase subunit K